ncbi:hypothetical protein BS47DRAFT_1350932 [Hydnum rufescens UP504]|uniref:Uncharacterized protein n=1 Tax=Hydnum rufescens UP504 TaxID=1448309 RepID=A0A9P6ALH5_9AGAM|nr:hypothetical protein BS47DRAFT_1350932 [Hydnum rufescens UP504]
MISNLGPFTTSSHIEVRERALNIFQLPTFMRADLSKHQEHRGPNPTSPKVYI